MISINREDIPNRVDLKLRYRLSGSQPDGEYVYGVLLFLSTPVSEVEKMLGYLKKNKDVDVYLLVFEEGYETEIIKNYVGMFKETFPNLEIRVQVGYPKETLDYMQASIEAFKEKREAKLN